MSESNPRAKAREREIERNLSKLRSDSPQERREAAQYLGEAAVSESIPELIDLYETDDDRKVRRAAAYALGQFKAIDRELEKGQQKKVELLLKRVEVNGKLGKRAPVGAAVQVSIILVVLFVLLLAANLFAPQVRARLDEARQIVESVAAPRRDRPTLIDDTETYYLQLRSDVEALAGEYQRVLGGDSVSCSVDFSGAPTYMINPADASSNPDIRNIAGRLNAVQESLQTSLVSYDEICAGTRELEVGGVGELMRPVVDMRASLEEIEPLFEAAGGSVAPTATPPPEPVGSAIVREHLAALNAIVEQMMGINGAAVQLVAYWGEAANTDSTAGCTAERPDIPDNYELPPDDAALSSNLAQAVSLINSALDATRNGWNQLQTSCGNDTLGQQARSGLINASAASDSFELARQTLAMIEDGDF
ncbi:MAG: HEAT repeat domain-containing protein [Anaerolineae bacterium]|nr:HEAT repeat domain-containing protein [Anaerolineae bacterium]